MLRGVPAWFLGILATQTGFYRGELRSLSQTKISGIRTWGLVFFHPELGGIKLSVGGFLIPGRGDAGLELGGITTQRG